MSRHIFTHTIPDQFGQAGSREGVAVVIDVLRAATTIAQALACGAECVVPCGEIDEARRIAEELPPETRILGGEREGLPIPGFDLGNSPEEYTSSIVKGKRVIFTTTNGTRALIGAKAARRVLVGALSNLTAVVNLLAGETGPVHLVCSGTDGRMTLEDLLCAGGIAHGLRSGGNDFDPADGSTLMALNLFDKCGSDFDRIFLSLRQSPGGRNLVKCGLEADIHWCATLDRFDIVPELDRERWQIRTAAIDTHPQR